MSADIFRIVNAMNYRVTSLESGLDALERMFDDLDRAGYTRLARELSDVLKQARVCERDAAEELDEERRYEIEDLNDTKEENARLKEDVERLTKLVEDLENQIERLQDDLDDGSES